MKLSMYKIDGNAGKYKILVRAGRSWKELTDEQGEPLIFTSNVCARKYIDKLS